MTHQQLTILDIPTHAPNSQHEYENQDTCNHSWVPGSDQHGLFAWRCRNCWETKKADPFADHNRIVKSAQNFKQVFEDYYAQYERSRTKKDQQRFLNAATDRYWKARLNFLRVGIDRPLAGGDFEEANPCPPDLKPIYEILTQKSPLNDLGKVSKGEVMDTSQTCTRGKAEDPDGTLTQVTPSTKTRRKPGEGSGYLFSSQINRKGKTYIQWWFQYEEKLKDGKRKKKTVYVPKTALDMVKRLNLDKNPVDTILEALGKKTTTEK